MPKQHTILFQIQVEGLIDNNTLSEINQSLNIGPNSTTIIQVGNTSNGMLGDILRAPNWSSSVHYYCSCLIQTNMEI